VFDSAVAAATNKPLMMLRSVSVIVDPDASSVRFRDPNGNLVTTMNRNSQHKIASTSLRHRLMGGWKAELMCDYSIPLSKYEHDGHIQIPAPNAPLGIMSDVAELRILPSMGLVDVVLIESTPYLVVDQIGGFVAGKEPLFDFVLREETELSPVAVFLCRNVESPNQRVKLVLKYSMIRMARSVVLSLLRVASVGVAVGAGAFAWKSLLGVSP
jgi:hypothetical protein